jgi:hypothetical protein
VPENRDAVQPWQVEIEHNQVIVEFGGECPSLFAIGGDIDRIMFRLQPLAHEASQGRVIFGDENTHATRFLCGRRSNTCPV